MEPWCGTDSKWAHDVIEGRNIPYFLVMQIKEDTFVCNDALKRGSLLYVTHVPYEDEVRNKLRIGKNSYFVAYRIRREECPL